MTSKWIPFLWSHPIVESRGGEGLSEALKPARVKKDRLMDLQQNYRELYRDQEQAKIEQ